MNDIPADVTAVELEDLWRIANMHFPKVENVYWAQLKLINAVSGDPDDAKFGRCHPWWSTVACLLERSMFDSVASLVHAASALNRAVDAYEHVDGNSSKALTAAGEHLKSILDSKGYKPMDWGVPDGYDGPNFNQPDSWGEEHDDD